MALISISSSQRSQHLTSDFAVKAEKAIEYGGLAPSPVQSEGRGKQRRKMTCGHPFRQYASPIAQDKRGRLSYCPTSCSSPREMPAPGALWAAGTGRT